jgi:hypothetical protein
LRVGGNKGRPAVLVKPAAAAVARVREREREEEEVGAGFKYELVVPI